MLQTICEFILVGTFVWHIYPWDSGVDLSLVSLHCPTRFFRTTKDILGSLTKLVLYNFGSKGFI